MALTGILRTGLVQLRVTDLEETLQHYRDRLGLHVVGKIDENRVMLKAYDEFDHHSLVLHKADQPGLDYMCFKALDEKTVEDIVRKTEEEFKFPMSYEDNHPGFGRIYFFTVPTGHQIGVYSKVELAENYPMVDNPHIWKEIPHGMGPACLDHALLCGPNQAETVRWFTECLGMSITEYVLNPDGQGHLCTWLSGNTRGHDVAILNFPKPGKIHHLSFQLQSWDEIGHAADIIGRYGIKLDAGPMRHGITRGQTIYFFDPSGNRNETYAGGYEYFPDHPTRKWTADHVGEGIFYYEKKLNERFLSVLT